MTDTSPSPGYFQGHTHIWPVRVYFEDTDAGGVVYHAAYLRYAERARTEMMRAVGVPHHQMIDHHGAAFAVRRCTIDFLAPAGLEDLLQVRTVLTAIGAATLDACQDIATIGGQDVARMQLRLACIGGPGRATRIPTPIRQALAAFVSKPSPVGDQPIRNRQGIDDACIRFC